MNYFDCLPEEIISHILSHLKTGNLQITAKVNKNIRKHSLIILDQRKQYYKQKAQNIQNIIPNLGESIGRHAIILEIYDLTSLLYQELANDDIPHGKQNILKYLSYC